MSKILWILNVCYTDETMKTKNECKQEMSKVGHG